MSTSDPKDHADKAATESFDEVHEENEIHEDHAANAANEGREDSQADKDNESASKHPKVKKPAGSYLVARFGMMKSIGRFSHTLEKPPKPATKVVIRTNRGVELGEVVAGVCDDGCGDGCDHCISTDKLNDFLESSGPDFPFTEGGKLMRVANRQDIIDASHLEGQAREEGTFCRKEVRQNKLAMRIITVEHLLGGERIIFYFSSDSRVDFRELVRKLAAQYRTRIEMRQVGARDEARLVGDYERCGRQCCCQGFLKHLKPVSMRMAKVQKATLDPTKISGRCGRLMCCLRFEDASYTEMKKLLPHRNTWVRTADAMGKVLDGQILTQLVRLFVPGAPPLVVANEDIIERDLPEPSAEQMQEQRTRPPRLESSRSRPQTQAPVQAQKAPSAQAESPDSPTTEEATTGEPAKKKRRRRRGPKKTDAQGQQPQGQSADKPQQAGQEATGPGETSGEGDGKKSSSSRRRRRRRRKKTE